MIEYIEAIRASHFRSIIDAIDIPMKSGMTFLVGPNNSGKTSLLKFIALLFDSHTDMVQSDLSTTNKYPSASLLMNKSAITKIADGRPILSGQLLSSTGTGKSFSLTTKWSKELSKGQIKQWAFSDDIGKILSWDYFDNPSAISKEFGSGSGRAGNLATFASALMSTLVIPKTIYVPSQRFILGTGQTFAHFGQNQFPGASISLNSLVDEVARLDRPPPGSETERRAAKSKLRSVENFLKHCLEVQEVAIEIPADRETIYITIDSNPQPISNVGSGIEQLLIIGLASFMFSDRIVLVDEPEIHLHPRTQKLMLRYLKDNSSCKFVMSTHSAAMLDSVEADIVEIWQENHQCFGRTVHDNSKRHEAVKNLGHSPSELVLANFVIWVEGPSDRIYINHWIQKLDQSLVEGTDYAVIFYGGSVLARHGFEDDGGDEDLVKALSISRNFAVYMDSDKESEIDELKSRVERVAKEVEANHGLGWISEGREIENYLPEAVLSQMSGFKLNPFEKFGKVVNGDFDKVKFAEKACKLWNDEWPLDLRMRCDELVARIQAAR